MARLKELEPVVESVLREYPKTTSYDFLLYTVVAITLNEDVSYYQFTTVMKRHKEFGIPPFESVTRCRRKLQAKYSELAGTQGIEELRDEEEQDYRAYAKDKENN